MQLTKEEGRDIVWNDHKDWKEVRREIVNHSRWSVGYVGVFLYKPSNKYYKLFWSIGATESQDERPFEYYDPKPVEVEKVIVKVAEWKPKGE